MTLTQIVRRIAIPICLSILLTAQVPPLAVVDEPLPTIESGVEFHVLLHANGGVPPYVWTVSGGDLPDGVTLTGDGLLGGRPKEAGDFDVTLKVEDSARPSHTINKEIRMVVTATLSLEWLQSPKVHDNRIDGSVLVSNGTHDTFDLTVVIVAIADNGRATAIGYEHFPLKAGSTNVEISFGNTLPPGPYVIHADAIAEIPKRRVILRQRLQTPQALQIVQGP
jgi:hypothetical protein